MAHLLSCVVALCGSLVFPHVGMAESGDKGKPTSRFLVYFVPEDVKTVSVPRTPTQLMLIQLGICNLRNRPVTGERLRQMLQRSPILVDNEKRCVVHLQIKDYDVGKGIQVTELFAAIERIKLLRHPTYATYLYVSRGK